MTAPFPYPNASQMRDHWWRRPGWREGRRFYTFFATFDDRSLEHLVTLYQQRLTHIPGLDPVPAPWLHLTVQGVGFVDEVSADDCRAVAAAVGDRLGSLLPAQLRFDTAVVHPEAVVLPAQPPDPLVRIKNAIRSGIVDALGPQRLEGPSDGYRPHVTLAYNALERDAAEVVEALAGTAPQSATVEIDRLSLVDLNRDHRAYRWTSKQDVAADTSPGEADQPDCGGQPPGALPGQTATIKGPGTAR